MRVFRSSEFTMESTARTIALAGMRSETSGGKSIGWFCMQGLNTGSDMGKPFLSLLGKLYHCQSVIAGQTMFLSSAQSIMRAIAVA